jgi:hypothetical protein
MRRLKLNCKRISGPLDNKPPADTNALVMQPCCALKTREAATSAALFMPQCDNSSHPFTEPPHHGKQS